MSASLNATDSRRAVTTTWLTPISFVRQLGEFDLDPCAYPGHETAARLVCLPEDGLSVEWQGRVWLNPPYGKDAQVWLRRLHEHGNGIALVFARLETRWIQPFLVNGFFQIQGRIAFDSPAGLGKGAAGSPSILIPFGRENVGRILLSSIKGRWFQ